MQFQIKAIKKAAESKTNEKAVAVLVSLKNKAKTHIEIVSEYPLKIDDF